MTGPLQKLYFALVLPALCLFPVLELAKRADLIGPGFIAVPSWLPAVLFVLSMVTAVAGPLFLRSLFAHSMRNRTSVPEPVFLRFQKRLLWVSQMTPYVSFAAVLLESPRFHAAASVLAALYALYYYFPSRKRVDFDRGIFKVG